MRRAVLAAVLLAAAGPEDHTTEHYDLHVETLDPKDVGAMLEELHAQLAKHFGRAPKGRLRLEVYSTRERWQEAMKRDGVGTVDAGGYYDPGTKKAYLFVQPSDYFSRQLILHEATHQFHYLAATNNGSPGTFWYTEGLAEYFGMHNWDGKALKTGVVPAITLEDYPAKALAQFDETKRDLEGILSGKVAVDRPVGWALVHWLLNAEPNRWRAVFGLLDQAHDPLKAWTRILGEVTPKHVESFRSWLEKHQQPWRVVWTAWQERGETIEGRSEVNGLAVLKQRPARLSVRFGRPAKGMAGLVFGFRSADEFHLFQITEDGQARIVRRANKKWEIVSRHDLPAAKDGIVLTAAPTEKGTTLDANGRRLAELPVAGDVGLNVDSARVEFKVVAP